MFCFSFRLLALVILLKEISILHHQRFWAQDKPRTSCLGRHGLLLWPDSSTSFPSIRSSSILPSLVFTGYTKRVSSHLTHNVQPILDDDDHKPLRGKTKEQSKGTRTRRTSSSGGTPTSPTKKKEPRQRGTHPQHTVISPTGKMPPTALKHSPTGAFSPTKHYGHTFSTQMSPNRRHHGLPLSPSWTHQQSHGPHPGEFHMGDHHPSLGHVPLLHSPSSHGSCAMHSPPGRGRASLHSPTGHVLPPLYMPPGNVAPPHATSHPMQPFSPTR